MFASRRAPGLFGATAVALALTLSSCANGGGTASTGGGKPIGVEELEEVFVGTYEGPPTSAPEHDTDKELYLVSCGQSIPFCVTAVEGAEEAADALGWKTTVIDSKGDFNAAGQGVRQAIAAEADGVFIYSMDCEFLKQPIQEARDAGVAVVSAQARDCNQDLHFEDNGGPDLYNSVVSYVEGDMADWLGAYGQAQAKIALAKSGEGTKSVSFFFSELGTSFVVADAYTKYLTSKCSDCEDIPVGFTFAEAASGLQEKAEQALLKHPDADALRVDSDGSLPGGVLQAARAGAPNAILIAAEGQGAVLDVVREGDSNIAGGVATVSNWEGWAAVDGLLRAFADEPAVSSGIGIQVWDEDHNMSKSGAYEPAIDYRGEYRKAWGVE